MSGIIHGRIMSHHLRRLERVEHTGKLAGCGGIVIIHNTYRHLHRLSALHQSGEEYGTETRHDNHARQIYRIFEDDAYLAGYYVI
jgi:hypothetical protein